VRRQGRVTGLLPLLRKRGALLSMANWHSPEFAPLAEDDSSLAELIGAALAQTSVRLDIPFLTDGSPVIDAAQLLADARGFDLLVRPILRSPFLETEGGWKAYEQRLPAKKRKEDRRRRRRLEEQGEISFEVSDGRANLPALLREGFEVEAMEGERKTPILTEPATTRFYTEVAEWAAQRGWLRLWFLRVDGHAAAFSYGIEHGGVHYDLKIGFDPRYRRFAPGMLLMRAQIEHAFDTSLRRYEFVGGTERHKLEWTDTARSLNRLQVFPRTMRGVANRLAWRHGRPAVKRLLRR
jgi:CelD/BcsL family acetyltransferase involved in cellulose biosynthesis